MKYLFLVLSLLFCAAPALAQETGPSQKVAARLVAEGQAQPGGSVWIALEETIRPGWHTYWTNPGEVGGLPTAIDWTLPSGWKAGDIVWPWPQRLPVEALKQMDYGYENKVWLLTKVSVPANARPGETVTLKAHASYLVCKDVCIPEEQALAVPLTIGGGMDLRVAKDFAAARARLPIDSPWPVNFAVSKVSCIGKADPDTGRRQTAPCLDLYVAASPLVAAHPKAVDFFPLESGMVVGDAPMRVGYGGDGLVLRVSAGAKAVAAKALTGVLVLTGSDGVVQALNVNASPGAVPVADFAAPEAAGGAAAPDALPLWLMMLFAALGGLILNIMPCVLPILAMKTLALARHAGSERRVVVTETLSYTAGAVVSFLILGLALLLLRAGGEAVGWGFQMQSPIAVAGFALLVFAVGLNLSGVFEVGSITAGENLTHKSGATGAFFTGVLAVAVGAPCTMPVGATALGFALTQSAATAMLVFLALGIGFALPFLILGLVPGALAFVPKPGTWMLRFKQLLAFPMYGAAAWLAWTLAVEAGVNSLILLFAALIVVALAAWLWSVTRALSTRGRLAGTLAVILLLLGAGAAVAQLKNAAAPQTASVSGSLKNTEPYTAARLAELRAEGRPVFVDATAAWCISCLVNEQTSLSRAAVQKAFADRKIAYLVADFTNRNAEGAALLSAHDRAGPPLYLYYAPKAATPAVLPQVLTPSIILNAIGG